MKRTQRKDALRNIWKQIVSYLSIIVIALLGVTIFLGIDYSGGALEKNGSDMYNAVNFRDIELVSTLLMTPADLDAILETDGVQDAEAVWQTGGKVSSGETRKNVSVITLTERLNRVALVEGRLPQTAEECAVEQRLADEMGWHVGDTITVLDAKGQMAEYLTRSSFLVCGIADHPDHVGTSMPDTLYVMVCADAFDLAALENCFMKAEVVIAKRENVDRFSSGYERTVAAVQERLDALAEVRAAQRDSEVRGRLQGQIDEGRSELDKASEQLRQARNELDGGWSALRDGEAQIAEGEPRLAEGKVQLDQAAEQLEATRWQLSAAEDTLKEAKDQLDAVDAELRNGKAQLDSGRTTLEDGWDQLEDAKAAIRNALRGAVEEIYGGDSSALVTWAPRISADVENEGLAATDFWITETYKLDMSRSLNENIEDFVDSQLISDAAPEENGEDVGMVVIREALIAAVTDMADAYENDYNDLSAACAAWDAGRDQYISGLSAYRAGLAQYEAGLAEYEAGVNQYEAGLAAYRNGLALYDEKAVEYEQGVAALEQAKKEAAEGRKKLDDGERQYTEGLAKYEDGAAQLAQASQRLESLPQCRWVLLVCGDNSSFVQLLMGSRNLSSLEMTFSLMFVLVGALVIYATIGKMIDEQRSLVGAGKALGLYNREILVKYLTFGVSATLLGTVLGILTARFAVEPYVLQNTASFYTFDATTPALIVRPTVIALAAGVLLSVAATWFACKKLLRSTAMQLMQAKVPEGRKTSGKSGGHVLSLYSRLILLNIRTDIRRVLVTVVSVAGCCALVVIGFTLNSAVNGATEKQYTKIVDYDGRIQFDPETAENAGDEIGQKLRLADVEYAELYDGMATLHATENMVGELLVVDISQISSFYHLLDWKTDAPLAPTDEGILIQKRTAEVCGLEAGSEIELSLNGAQSVTARVAGVFDNYIGRMMMMSPAYYKELFGADSRTNAFYIRLNGADDGALLEALRQVKGFESYTSSDADKSLVMFSSSLMTAVVALFIFMAAVMAGVVLMNLTNSYILQKKRELTVMRVNGFTVREVIGYVARETVVTTILGILIGIAEGAGAAYRIARDMEPTFIQYVRSPDPMAWLYGALITGLFALAINVIVLRKIRDLKLTDVA